MTRSIRTTWLVMLLLFSLLPLLLAGTVIAWTAYSHEREHALELQHTATSEGVAELESFIKSATSEARLLAESPSLLDLGPDEQGRLLSQLFSTRPAFAEIALVDAAGQERARVLGDGIVGPQGLRSRAGEEWLAAATGRDSVWYGPVALSPAGEPLLPVAIPVMGAQATAPAGALRADIRLREIFDTIASVQLSHGVSLQIINSAGLIVAHPQAGLVGQSVDLARYQESGSQRGPDGAAYLVTPSQLQIENQTIIIVGESPEALALEPAYEQIRVIGAILAGSALLAALTGIFAARRLTRPIADLAKAAQRIGDGELGSRVAVTSRDEVGLLQDQFNQMAERLAEQRQRLAEHHDRLRGELIEQNAHQREMIRELSIPVLPVGDDTLVMPLIGDLDGERLARLQERALAAINASRARHLLIDVTGVAVIDEEIARSLLNAIRAVRLLGAEVALVGVRAEVAIAIIKLGIDLSEIRTFQDIETALHSSGSLALPR